MSFSSINNKKIIQNESPIRTADEDILNFTPYAKKIREIIQGYASNSEPLTIGIYGKWGSGKTSMLNLIEKNIEKFKSSKKELPYIRYHYSPWIYQSEAEMLEDFFETLSRKTGNNSNDFLKDAGKAIKKYSRYLKSIKLSANIGIPNKYNFGASFEPSEILNALGEDLEGEIPTLEDLKNEINKKLTASKYKIIIFIDDVDRLDKDEIYTLFKLIKVVANFDNLIFILALDPEYVAEAIYSRYGDNKKAGKDFLEKIINIPLTLPLIEKEDMDYLLKQKVHHTLSQFSFDETKKQDLLSRLHGKYFNSPREIIRVVNSFTLALYSIGGEVNIKDLFWIEYLKIKYFGIYNKIKNYNVFMKKYIDFNEIDQHDSSGLRLYFEDNHPEAFIIIDMIFPKIYKNIYYSSISFDPESYDKNKRINSIQHFEKYFSFHTIRKISELSFSEFIQYLKEKNDEKAKSVIDSFIENKVPARKIVYKLSDALYDDVNKDNPNIKLIEFIGRNLKYFNDIFNPNEIRDITNAVGNILSINRKYQENAINFAKQLTYLDLVWFIYRIKENPENYYLNKLTEILVKKIKIDNFVFFTRREGSYAIIKLWSSFNKKDLINYLDTHINSENQIYLFFKCFTHFWNNEINGIISYEIYRNLGVFLDHDFIFKKINELILDIPNLEILNNIESKWDDYADNSGSNNVKQFLYHYLTEKKKEEKEVYY